YMREEILMPLGLNSTIVGVDYENPAALKALGYKIGFFEPRAYNSPVFRGNNPAGYVVSSGRDIATYLKLHLGVLDSDFTHLAQKSQQMDTTVPPSMASLTSYGMGWSVSVSGSGQISHDGYNPNFTAFLGFNHKAKIGVAVMANCDSDTGFTAGYIGDWVMAKLTGAKFENAYEYSGSVDKSSSVSVFFLGFFALSILAFIVILVKDIVVGKRKFEKVSLSKLGRMLATPLLLAPFIYGVIIIPEATYNADWSFMSIWGPSSLMMAIYSLIGCLALCYCAYLFSAVFPTTNKYVRSAPMLILLSLLNGGANAVVIFLISSSLYSPVKLSYMMYYFALAMFAYIGGRKVMQTKMIGITLDIVYDMRMKLFNKIFLTSYEKFESLDRGRVYATLNDDTNQIGNSANLFVALISSIITVIGCFMYLAAIAFWATAVTIGVIVAIAALYYVVGQKAQIYFEQARDTRNVFMRLLNGMLDGFKEL
ncbi:MAG: serine hydrolase, partial [bacterium]|nr:serine hydrolase [bacterium]